MPKLDAHQPANDSAAVDDLDERQPALWMKQAAAMPGFGGKRR